MIIGYFLMKKRWVYTTQNIEKKRLQSASGGGQIM
jgi:hypothetical protein